jgi:hypothetical protein
MVDVATILRDKKSQTFFSFLIGLGLTVMLFHRPVFGERVLALPPSEFDGRTVKYNGKCVVYRVEDAPCEITSTK